METIFNLAAIRKKIKGTPNKSALYYFFWGANTLTEKQITEIEAIVDEGYAQMKEFLAEQKHNITA